MRALVLLLLSTTAFADGSVRGTVDITRPDNAEPKAVVVYLTGFAEPPPKTVVTIEQHDRRFQPALVAITAGQTIEFPNGDPFMHNVFSNSGQRKFDLGSYPKGESRSRVFPDTGVIDVYCNVHPEMSATILVVPNRRFTLTAIDGSFEITGVPPGKWTVFAYSRRAQAPVHADVEVKDGNTAEVKLQLVEHKRSDDHANKFGEKYRDPDETKLYQ
jgi:plastocyanin